MNPNDTEVVKVVNLRKSFGSAQAIRDVSFVVPRGTIVSLLGPSGCGKTTTLRCIAGLDSPDNGVIYITGEKVTDVDGGIEIPPEKRSIGMVFQSYAVWPHMTVFENIAFPLTLQKNTQKKNIKEKVQNILTLVGLTNFGDRPATDLSGGQQQRVALARALVGEPTIVLFDEPLSNLDAKLREYMRMELLALQRRLGFTAIYVTHDQQEALSLSDQLIVMKDGFVEQQGTPSEIYRNPQTSFVADFMGSSNMIKGRIEQRRGPNEVIVQLDEISVRLISRVQTEKEQLRPGVSVMISFRPEATGIVVLDAQESFSEDRKEVNKIPGRVNASLFMGDFFDYSVQVGGICVKARSQSLNPIPCGASVNLTVSTKDCLALPIL